MYLLSVPCAGGNGVYVCGVNACGVYALPGYGCQFIDPATGYIPHGNLPPGSIVVNGAGAVRFATCCECGESPGCLTDPIYYPSAYPQCYENRTTCCCSADGNGIPRGQVRVLECSIEVVHVWPGNPGGTGTSRRAWSNETIDANGCATYTQTDTVTGFAQLDYFAQHQTSHSCRACGWTNAAPLLPEEIIGVYAGDAVRCQPFSDSTQTIVPTQFSMSATCTAFALINVVRWDSLVFPGYYRITTARNRMVIVNGGVCGGNCAGRIVTPGTPTDPPTDIPGGPPIGGVVIGCNGCQNDAGL